MAGALTVIVLAGTVLAATMQHQGAGIRPLGAAGYTLVGACSLTSAFRNVAPRPAFTVTLGLTAVYEALGYPGGPIPLAVIVVVFTIAEVGDRQRALGLGLVATAVLIGTRSAFVSGGFSSPLLITFPTAIVAALYAGQLLANRTARRQQALQDAAELQLRREREMHARVRAERLRIARELHDVVSHNISMISVQATMGVHVIDEQPAQAAAALLAIKDASRQTLRELRAILNVLRQADESDSAPPVPGLGELDALILSTDQAGLPVRLRLIGDVRPLPAAVNLAAFRIVQESLTNALRYAGWAQTTVAVHFREISLSIEVVDEGARQPAPATPGHGIAGMTERAAAVGGTLSAGPGDLGGFVVRAELPIAAHAEP